MITRRDLCASPAALWPVPASKRGLRTLRSPAPATDWRRFFPALSNSPAGPDFVYLDSAATTQRPVAVLDTLTDFYARDNANPGKSQHALARRAHEQYEDARQTVATWINAATAEEVVWVRGTTEAINLVASAWGAHALRAGDEILLTVAEHASNLLPWKFAAERVGARLRFVDVDDEGRISLEDLDRKLSNRTRILAFSHVSNVAGYINPAAQICAHARQAGALTLIDAAQSAPHVPIDVRRSGVRLPGFLQPQDAGSNGYRGSLGTTRIAGIHASLSGRFQYGSCSSSAGQRSSSMRRTSSARVLPMRPGHLVLRRRCDFWTCWAGQSVMAHEQALTDYALRRLREDPAPAAAGTQGCRAQNPRVHFRDCRAQCAAGAALAR